MPAETVTYNKHTHRLEWGGRDDRTFLTVTSPWRLSQEAMDRVLASLVGATQERDGIRKRIAEEVRAKGCICLILARAGEADFSGRLVAVDLDATLDECVEIHDCRCPEAIAAEIEAAGEEFSDVEPA